MPFYVGLDLGQSADYTALAVIHHVWEQTAPEGKPVKRLHLRHLERFDLRTPYPEIAQKVAAMMRDERLRATWYDTRELVMRAIAPELVVDITGVGKAVTELLKSKGLRFKSVTITAGEQAHYANGSWRVPKLDLVAALEVSLQTDTLKVAESLELWPTLQEEMLNFKRKVKLNTPPDSYEYWRESEHDDLVLATALACWGATRKKGTLMLFRKPVGF
jgi:hypothetical protein